MLINKSFIYLKLPRTGTSSFLTSCKKYKLQFEHYDSEHDIISSFDDFYFLQIHEPLHLLLQKFGKNYEIIAVKRDKYETFISFWKHIIKILLDENNKEAAKILKKLNYKELFDLSKIKKIYSYEDELEYVNDILIKNKIKFNKIKYIKILHHLLFRPAVYFHNNNENIIWFDFHKLDELEKWVSKKLNIEFKLNHINGTKDVECNIKNTKKFKIMYDEFFKNWNDQKTVKSLL